MVCYINTKGQLNSIYMEISKHELCIISIVSRNMYIIIPAKAKYLHIMLQTK